MFYTKNSRNRQISCLILLGIWSANYSLSVCVTLFRWCFFFLHRSTPSLSVSLSFIGGFFFTTSPSLSVSLSFIGCFFFHLLPLCLCHSLSLVGFFYNFSLSVCVTLFHWLLFFLHLLPLCLCHSLSLVVWFFF